MVCLTDDGIGDMTEKEMREQILYWKRNPDMLVEWLFGYKLPWHKRMWLKLFSRIKDNKKSTEEMYCPDCARQKGLNWHVFEIYNGMPHRYKCTCCGREYYENEDE